MSSTQLLNLLLICLVAPVSTRDQKHRHPAEPEREVLRHFLGLRHSQEHAIVVPHALRMLNHRVHRTSAPRHLNSTRSNLTEVLRLPGTLQHGDVGNSSNLENSSEAIAAYVVKKPDWNKIDLTRGQMCVDMLKEHGVDFTDNKDKCIVFMEKKCKVPDGKGICTEWFDLLGKVKNGGHANNAAAPSPAHAQAPSGQDNQEGSNGMFHMDENEKIPEQGFGGKPVAHDDMVTQTSDWHAEYGPHSKGHKTYAEICAAHPNNLWCKLRDKRAKRFEVSRKESVTNMKPLSAWQAAVLCVLLCLCVGWSISYAS